MRSLRTALIWMLMLALPAQSMAAIGMQLGAATHTPMMMAPLVPLMAAHHPGAMVIAQSAEASAHGDHSSHTSSAADNRLCSLCAFCVGAVALSSVTICHAPLQLAEPLLARREQFVGFISDPLERPPRLFLA
jgi:hypothetical protein